MSAAVVPRRSSRSSKRQADAAVQNILAGLTVRGIPAKELTLDNLRKGLQQQPQKWVPTACQLIKAAPAACQDALCADEALVTGLAAHLAKSGSSVVRFEKPASSWQEGLDALVQLLMAERPVVLAVDTILPIYMHSFGTPASTVEALTLYVLSYPILTEAVLQHPTLLVDLLRWERSTSWPELLQTHVRSNTLPALVLILARHPTEAAAHGPFMAELCQLLAAGNAGTARLLTWLGQLNGGRQLITSQPQLLKALAVALQGPNAAWPNMLVWLPGFVDLVSSPASSPVVLAHPACCQYLVESMATALRSAPELGTDAVVDVWGWLEEVVSHEPSRQVLLTWRPQQQAPSESGGQQGEAAAPPQPAATAAAAGAVPPGAAAAAAGAVDEAAAGVPGPAAAAAGSDSFLAALAGALQDMPAKALRPAGAVLCTLLAAAPDPQQLLEALQVSSWLKSIHVGLNLSQDAHTPWVQAVALLLGQPAGRAALWAAPRLLQWVLVRARDEVSRSSTVADSWQQVRDQLRADAGYQAALLQGLRSSSSEWVLLLFTEMMAAGDTTVGSCEPVSPAYSILHLPGLPEALAAACMQERVARELWWVLRHLLEHPPGQALLDAHPPLVTAVASLFARADHSLFGDILEDMQLDSEAELRTCVLSQPQLLKGLVMGAVSARRQCMYQVHTASLAGQPWFQQAVEGDGEVLDALLRALGPVARSQLQQQQQHGWGAGHNSPSCQEAVLAQLNKEALFPKLLQRLSSVLDVKLVQGAWNGLDWLRRSGAPWDQDVPAALGNMVKAAGRASELPQLQLEVTQTAVQLAQEHVALREQRQQLEAARAELAAAGGGTGGGAAAAADATLPQQQEGAGGKVQAGRRKGRQQRKGSSAAVDAAASEVQSGALQPSRKRARKL